MSELIPFTGGGAVAKTRQDIRVALVKLDGLAEYNDRAQEYAADLMARARARAQLFPGSEQLLAQLLQTFVMDALSIQHGMYRRY
jgi:hypothetical protein